MPNHVTKGKIEKWIVVWDQNRKHCTSTSRGAAVRETSLGQAEEPRKGNNKRRVRLHNKTDKRQNNHEREE